MLWIYRAGSYRIKALKIEAMNLPKQKYQFFSQCDGNARQKIVLNALY